MSRPTVSFSAPVWPRQAWPRAAALALLGVALAGCSNSSRFDTPYASNQHQPVPRGDVTGSVAPRPAPVARVTSQPLPQPSAPQTVASGGGYSGGSQGLGAYRPATRASNSDITGSVTPQPVKPAGHWTWDGGSPVTVGHGDTVEKIARKHGVPASAILETNGITDPSQIRPGQRLVIPRYISGTAATASASAPRIAAPAYVSAAAPSSSENVHVVTPGESLIGIARRNNMSLSALARYNGLPVDTRLNIGDRVNIPGSQQAAASQPAPRIAASAPLRAPQVSQPRTVPLDRVASVPTQSVRVATQEAPQAETPVEKAEPAGTMPSFRWPVQGRVIAGFGPRPNGAQNDGINIAVPEGTPVKAADDGVVAYSGNELKGYGNLVLIRHANGYVSAYANASELLVKRGDSIRRGQVIAHAGQTGNVTSPQLHFEIRKGSTPVDPTKYLSGN